MQRWRNLAGAVAVLACCAVPESGAQEFLTLEFSLSNPGARSLGFGGAFVALADDATAAFANPAGLMQIARPEVSVETRARSYTTLFTEGGRVSGTPTGWGIDTVAGLRTGESSADTEDLSFVGFVYPGERWSVAFYRHQLASFESLLETQGLFGEGLGPGSINRILDLRTSTDLEIVTLALSGAYRISEAVSVGAGLAFFQGTIDTVKESYLWDEDTVESYLSQNSYLPGRMVERNLVLMDDTAWGVSIGVLWILSERFRIGGTYRQGPGFDFDLTVLAGPAFPGVDAGTVLLAGGSPITLPPDVYGLGAAYRSPSDRLTLSFEWDRVEYSAMVESLDPRLREEAQVRIDDADELHLGAEYVFIDLAPIVAARVGIWLDPEHRLHSTGDNIYEQAIFRPGDDELHYAIGAGVTFERFQLDLAGDFSDLADTMAFSLIYSF